MDAMPVALKQRLSRCKAMVAALKHEWTMAASFCTAATDLNPKDGMAWLILGDIHFSSGVVDSASEAMCRALKLLSEEPGVAPPLRLFYRLGHL